jgi:hypothetical protein
VKASQCLELTGAEQVWRNLDDLTAVIRDKILKRAMKLASDPILKRMKDLVPRDFDVLHDAIEVKITSAGGKGDRIRCYVGIRRGVKIPTKTFKRGKRKGRVLIAIPTKYAHLVEFGFTKKLADGSEIRVRPKPFVRPAWDEFGGEVALYTFAEVCEAMVSAEVIRFAINNSH